MNKQQNHRHQRQHNSSAEQQRQHVETHNNLREGNQRHNTRDSTGRSPRDDISKEAVMKTAANDALTRDGPATSTATNTKGSNTITKESRE